MPDERKAETIRRLFLAFMSGDRATAEALLTDDFRFSSPYDDRIDRATYFEQCWPNSVHIANQTLEKIFVDGDEAFVLYKCATKDGKEFRNTEFFTFRNGRIAAVQVFFGATYKKGRLEPA